MPLQPGMPAMGRMSASVAGSAAPAPHLTRSVSKEREATKQHYAYTQYGHKAQYLFNPLPNLVEEQSRA